MPAAAHVPLRPRGRRPPDAGQPGPAGRGMDLLGAGAPAAVRRARLRADRVRPHRAAAEAGGVEQAQAVQAQGPRGLGRLLHRVGLPGRRGAVLPARPGQRPARRDAAGGRPGRPIRLAECGLVGRAVDLVKLDDICADYIATLSSEEILPGGPHWALTHDTELARRLARTGRSRCGHWPSSGTGRPTPARTSRSGRISGRLRVLLRTTVPAGDRPGPTPARPDRRGRSSAALAADFAASYAHLADPQEWFEQIRALAARHDFAPEPEGVQGRPGPVPGLDPGGVPDHPGRADRLDQQPRPAPGGDRVGVVTWSSAGSRRWL